MGRYTSDDNIVTLYHESGTYGTSSGNGVWIGQISEHNLTDDEGYARNRYLGTGSRTSVAYEQGLNTVEGTLTFRVQDWKVPFYAIGSVCDTSGTNCVHTATEILTGGRQSAFTSGPFNPPFSFTIEDSKQTYGTRANFNRTINGAVPNTVTITMSQGERISAECGYVAQAATYSSGTPAGASVTAMSGDTFQWGNVTVSLGGTTYKAIKEVTFEINNNIEGAFYLNGSRISDVPTVGNKDYTLTLTLDAYHTEMQQLYKNYYKSGQTFNAEIDLEASSTSIGSKHVEFYLSGCRVISADIPSPSEGVNEATFEIAAQNVNATAWDRTLKYNPW